MACIIALHCFNVFPHSIKHSDNHGGRSRLILDFKWANLFKWWCRILAWS